MKRPGLIFYSAVCFFILFLSFSGCANKVDTQEQEEGKGTGYCGDVPPAKGQSCVDPVHGGTITRITDKAVDGYSGPGIENEYSRSDPENSSGTHIILRGNDGTWYLYDSESFENLRSLSQIASGEQEPEPRWDATNPKLFYYLYGTELRSYNIDNNSFTKIHDFKEDYPAATNVTTQTEGTPSSDRRFWCLQVRNGDQTLAVITYDKTSDSVIGAKTSFPDEINWVSMDMSGDHCVVGYDSRNAQVFARDFSSTWDLPSGASGHMDLSTDSSGNDVMVYQDNATDWIAMVDLKTGVQTKLVPIPFSIDDSLGIDERNTDIGLHFSGNCKETPGWVLVSTYGSKNPPTVDDGCDNPPCVKTWMDNLLFMVELKANPSIHKLSSTHSYTSKDFTGEKNYFAEAFAAINRKGNKVYFGSNWGIFTNEYSDVYVVEIPNL